MVELTDVSGERVVGTVMLESKLVSASVTAVSTNI